MDAIKNAYYRSFQAVFNVAARCLLEASDCPHICFDNLK